MTEPVAQEAAFETLSSLEKARVVREDQGLHETEISFGGEADLHTHYIQCLKHPNHTDFIPIGDFTLDHLKPYCSDQDIFSVIRSEADMTARILTTHTSNDRPKYFPNSNKKYPFYNYRGTKSLKTGTGWIRWVSDKFTKEDKEPCPCIECENSSNPKFEWGRVYVRTAQHVVFNTEEARLTKCQLFYDKAENRNSICTLYGVSVGLNILTDDWSELTCVTHDLELWNKLSQLDRQREALYKRVRNKFLHEQTKLAVIISHPHGCSKQVSVGEWVHKEKVGQYDYTRYIYTTSTCPGSSGAPVYILGDGRWFLMTNHPHSKRCEQDGLNQSGTGWE